MDEAAAFLQDCRSGALYAPLSDGSRYFLPKNAGLDQLGALSKVLPVQLVEVMRGELVSVYVIGESAIAISTWDGRRVEVGLEVECHCVAISRTLGLSFCVVDLVRTTDEDWYCSGISRRPLFPRQNDVGEFVLSALVSILAPEVR